MDLRRKKPVDMLGVKRTRRAYTGKVTIAWDKLSALKYLEQGDLQRLDIIEVQVHLKTLLKSEAGFASSLEEAEEFAPADEDEYETFQTEEDESSEVFTLALQRARRLGGRILAYKAMHLGIRAFKSDLKALKTTLEESPEQDYSPALAELRINYSNLREQWAAEDLETEHPLQAEMDGCRKSLTEMEGSVSTARTLATPTAITTTPSSVPSTLPREMEPKLPAMDIPTFSGDIMKWRCFWSGFEATVDSNRKLSKPSKLSYLRKAVRDPSSQTLLYSPQEDADFYDEVVASLKLRFDRTKEIHRNLVHDLVSFTNIKYTRADLRQRVDNIKHLLSSLKHTGHYDLPTVLTSLVYATLPAKLQTLWDQHNMSNKKVSPVQELLEYVSNHAETLPANYSPATDKTTEPQGKRPPHRKSNSSPRGSVYVAAPSPPVSTTTSSSANIEPRPYRYECILCSPERHPLHSCPKWGACSAAQRMNHVNTHKLCHNCLKAGHTASVCYNKYKCQTCKERHHTSLHSSVPASTVAHVTVAHTAVAEEEDEVPDALITTAKLLLIGPDGTELPARALIDSGASISLVTQRVAQMLLLPLQPTKLRLSVVQGEVSRPLKHRATIHLSPLHYKGLKLKCKPYVAPTVTADLPPGLVPSVTHLPHLAGLPLADPSYNLPGRIDILLGADMAPAILSQVTSRKGGNDEPMAQATIFGWSISGPVPGFLHNQASILTILPRIRVEPSFEPQLEDLLRAALHEQGEPGDASPVTVDEINQQVEKQYSDTVEYNTAEQRYTVSLPRKNNMLLGNSKGQATSRFINTENGNLKKGVHPDFQEAVGGYLTSGHAEEVPPESSPPADSFYLPMHGVYKDSSSSTKLRIVFDGSATTTAGLSLNQQLHGGPTIQATLTDTLIKFRSYPIALNADVGKMFREIKLSQPDKDLHRFVWRRNPSEALKDYRMNRVTFGISSSPFLAIRTLHQIAADHGEDFPEASHHILSSFYVDDFLGGANSPEEAIKLFNDIRRVLSQGNFQLRKWRSSSDKVIQQIPEELLEKDPVKESTANNPQTNSKALGLVWNSHSDVMSPSIAIPTSYKPTKRGLISAIYKTYDILGWISPTTLQMKLMIQKLWREGHGWDTTAPSDAVDLYNKWKEELPVLRQVTLPRHYSKQGQEITEVTLHGFADASDLAYGAVVYYRTCYSKHPPTTVLVTSKTKLAKLPKATTPRLELCAALLLANLLQSVGRVLDIPPLQWHAWSDNSAVLCWLDGHPRTHPIFVSNRVDKTLAITPPAIWHHVPTLQNPADCASRGLSPSDLLRHHLWWKGPQWLHKEPWVMPHQPPRKAPPPEVRTVCVLQIASTVAEQITALDFQNYTAVVAVAAWVRRFCNRIQEGRPSPDERTRVLTGQERKEAQLWLFREAQRRAFPQDRQDITNNKLLGKSSRLKTLNPYIDDKLLLRIGGRLTNSDLALSQKHPVILDGKDLLMEKYFIHLHLALCHCGPTLLLCHVGKKLHVLGARRLCRKLCAKCVRCRTYRPRLQQQKMGELPAYRVTSTQVAFDRVGIDCAGPFTTKAGRVRNPLLGKAHICAFVCLTTKAVHLEVVSEESTAAFQAALDRFIARRGCPSHIFSDNGGNFVGARNDLQGFYKFLKNQRNNEEIQHYLASQHETTWHNIPARSPHMGGLWEAAVKSLKTHLHRVIGFTRLTYEELNTITTKIEACLNSRPLLPLHSHPTDGIDVLTPGHFLTGRALMSLPEDPIPTERPHLLQTWRRCQAMAHHIWTRWSKEYLNSLQARTKWQSTKNSIQVGDIVIIKPKAHFFSCHWPLGRVTRVFPGKDNLVRVVEVKTKKSLLKRSVTELALLYREEDDDQTTDPAEDAAPPPQPVQAPSTALTTQQQ